FHDAPVAMLLAVFAANLVAQKHDRRLPKTTAVSQETWSAPQADSHVFATQTQCFSGTYRNPVGTKFPKPWSSCESRANEKPSGVSIRSPSSPASASSARSC